MSADSNQYHPMVTRWATSRDERVAIESFFVNFVYPTCDEAGGTIGELMDDNSLDELLDQYFGIDRRQLERERRAILELHRKGSSA